MKFDADVGAGDRVARQRDAGVFANEIDPSAPLLPSPLTVFPESMAFVVASARVMPPEAAPAVEI